MLTTICPKGMLPVRLRLQLQQVDVYFLCLASGILRDSGIDQRCNGRGSLVAD